MALRSFSDILAGIDTGKVSVDASGRIGSDDPSVEAHLNELREALADEQLAQMECPDGVQCHCTNPIQSGCPQ